MKDLLEQEVINGKDGFLFLGKGNHKIIDYITGKSEIERSSLENFHNNIKNRSEICKKMGIPYKHFVYPCKHSVMNDHFPLTKYTSLIDYYKPYFTTDVIDMRDILNTVPRHVYLQKDTHLNFEGKKRAVHHTFNVMLNKYENYNEILDACKGDILTSNGDLGSKVIPEETEELYKIKTPWNLKRYNNRIGVGNDGLVHIVFNVKKLKKYEFKRCLIFGDSFSYLNLPLLSYEFSEILFLRTRYFHDEIISMYKPDVVFSQNVERYLSHVDSDENAPVFNLIYGLRNKDYCKDSEFYSAYNAVLKYGSKTYWNFISSITNKRI